MLRIPCPTMLSVGQQWRRDNPYKDALFGQRVEILYVSPGSVFYKMVYLDATYRYGCCPGSRLLSLFVAGAYRLTSKDL